MPLYTYKALDRQGRQTTGTLPAESKGAAFDQLASQGLSPVAVSEQVSSAASGSRLSRLFGSAETSGTTTNTAASAPPPAQTKVSQASLESFTREMANLLAAGLPLSRALGLLRREASQPVAKRVWSIIHDDVVGGTSLADALAKWPRIFSSVYIAMVRAGEAGGFLHVVLQQIADFRAREQELRGKVKAAMIYPAVLATVACGVLIFLLTFFIPRFSTIFAEFGESLPALTQAIVTASNAVKIAFTRVEALFFWGAVVAGVIAAKRAADTDAGRRAIERMVLRLPGIGRVSARFALVRFCRMLGTLVGAGVPLVSSLRTAREALGNQTLADTVSHAIEEVQRGSALSKSLAVSPVLFPPSVVEMVAVAEETGRLDKELVRLSVSYEAELERNLRMLVALAEPVLLFVMAAVIGTVVVGMLLPVFMLQDLVK